MSHAITFVTMRGRLTQIELDSIVGVYPLGKGSVLVVRVGDEWLECEVFEPAAEVRLFIDKELNRRRQDASRGTAGG
jgi:hypothetical protein